MICSLDLLVVSSLLLLGPQLGVWTLTYPEYSTTSNGLMKRVRLIKSRPTTAQMSNSDSQAAADVEVSSLPNSPVPRGNLFESREGGSNITTSAVGTEGPEVPPQGEPEEESRDFNPDLDELVKKVDHHYHQLLRDTTLQGRIQNGLGFMWTADNVQLSTNGCEE